MTTSQKVLIFAPEQHTLQYLSDELQRRGYFVEWMPAESWHPDVFGDTVLVVLDLVDWAFGNRECVKVLRSYLANFQSRLFPVVVLVRPDDFGACFCGPSSPRTLFHQTHIFLDMDDLAAVGENATNLSSILFELTSSSNSEDWKRAERILLQLAIQGIRIPGCDEALQALEKHDQELGHKPRIRFVESILVACGTI